MNSSPVNDAIVFQGFRFPARGQRIKIPHNTYMKMYSICFFIDYKLNWFDLCFITIKLSTTRSEYKYTARKVKKKFKYIIFYDYFDCVLRAVRRTEGETRKGERRGCQREKSSEIKAANAYCQLNYFVYLFLIINKELLLSILKV